MFTGSKIYYSIHTGNVIVITPEYVGVQVESTKEQDFQSYKALEELVPESVDFIQLEYGQYRFDRFDGREIVRIDLETKEPLFNRPVDEGQEPPVPTPSLESQLSELKARLQEEKSRNERLEQESNTNQLALMELHMLLLNLMPDAG
ncbi:hypothetical protein ABIC86_002504 [Paenibacillus sp. DS2363]|uniref:hypothetical protein n=1 Tax=Paenibacillus sp. DS2363 TaxID=3156427 RepID=UPI003399861E